jgi:GNAT superfamily N-acetyltransferase
MDLPGRPRAPFLPAEVPETTMATEFTVRLASAKDAAAIAALSAELGYPVKPSTMGERLGRVLGLDDQRVLVAEGREGDLCGWLHARRLESLETGLRVEIFGLVVSPQARRRGVGRLLMARAEAWAAEISAESVVVRSNAKRLESHSFYPALGYLPWKTQVVYRKRPGA